MSNEQQEFCLPDVGEGLTEAEIVAWKVEPGDHIEVNATIVEIETAKSLVELPSPYSGTIAALLVSEGETVAVGAPILRFGQPESPDARTAPGMPRSTEAAAGERTDLANDSTPATAGSTVTEDTSASPEGRSSEELAEATSGQHAASGGDWSSGRQRVLVGYGPKPTQTRRRPRRQSTSSTAASPAASTSAVPEAATPPQTHQTPAAAQASPSGADTSDAATVRALAKPPVRKLAKDLGVDLGSVPPSGAGGVITRADVQAAANATQPSQHPPQPGTPEAVGEPSQQQQPPRTDQGPDHTPAQALQQGVDIRVPIRGVRKATAHAMVTSAFSAPHVTEWVEVDATGTMDVVERLKGRREFTELKISPLLVIAKACCLAMRRTPELNAVWDGDAQEIVFKGEVNLGIAVATARGLIVPHIKRADRRGLPDLAHELAELTRTARDGKTQPAQMQGTSFTLTNVGVFGVDGGTPILNPGESGILAIGAIRKKPWVVTDSDGTEHIAARWVTTLALSFDHRVVDGEQGSRFLADVAAIVEDPAAALLYA